MIFSMKSTRKFPLAGPAAVAIAATLWLGGSLGAAADEADAKRMLKAMSDHMGAQTALSFDFDAILEVVTKDGQKLALASSGSATVNRPDKIRVKRAGGFADMEIVFDGKTLTLAGNAANLYTQADIPGSIDNLVETLQDKYGRPLPAADLIMSNAYDLLMADTTQIMDLGSGVIGGVECDYLAFRAKDVDWQIWIAQGDNPYPCRYTIASKEVAGEPQYSIQIRNFKTGDAVAADTFAFDNPENFKKVDIKDLKGMSDLPTHFKRGAAQ